MSRSEPSKIRASRTNTPASRHARRRHQARHSPAVARSPSAAFQAKTTQGIGRAVKMQNVRNGKPNQTRRTL